MSGANLPDAVWSALTGIDVFIPHGPSRLRIGAALEVAFGLASGAVVDADELETYLLALSSHPVTVSVHRLSGPRFGWKCDAHGVFNGDVRQHLKALAAYLDLTIFALDEAEADPDALLAVQPDGMCSADCLRPGDSAPGDPPHMKDPS